MSPCTAWISTLSALLTPVIAISVGTISYRQWRTAQNKLKLDLFDRRLSIFESAIKLVYESQRPSGAPEDVMTSFLLSAGKARWLINQDVHDYLYKELYNKAINMKICEAEFSSATPDDEKSQKFSKLNEARNDILGQIEIIDKKFLPFLKVGH